MDDIRGSMTGPEAYKKAKHMAIASHASWLVWRLTDGTYYAARLSQETLETAMRECDINEKGNPVVVCVQGDGHFLNATK